MTLCLLKLRGSIFWRNTEWSSTSLSSDFSRSTAKERSFNRRKTTRKTSQEEVPLPEWETNYSWAHEFLSIFLVPGFNNADAFRTFWEKAPTSEVMLVSLDFSQPNHFWYSWIASAECLVLILQFIEMPLWSSSPFTAKNLHTTSFYTSLIPSVGEPPIWKNFVQLAYKTYTQASPEDYPKRKWSWTKNKPSPHELKRLRDHITLYWHQHQFWHWWIASARCLVLILQSIEKPPWSSSSPKAKNSIFSTSFTLSVSGSSNWKVFGRIILPCPTCPQYRHPSITRRISQVKAKLDDEEVQYPQA